MARTARIKHLGSSELESKLLKGGECRGLYRGLL